MKHPRPLKLRVNKIVKQLGYQSQGHGLNNAEARRLFRLAGSNRTSKGALVLLKQSHKSLSNNLLDFAMEMSKTKKKLTVPHLIQGMSMFYNQDVITPYRKPTKKRKNVVEESLKNGNH